MCSQIRKIDNYPLLSMLFLMFTLVTAGPNLTFCESSINYTLNSPFENNLKSLLNSLSSNISLKNGFYNTSSIVDGSDTVYGQALCRGDVNSTVCQNCVEKASQEIINQCRAEEAIIWHEFCQIQYSYKMSFSSTIYSGHFPKSNDEEERNVSAAQFPVVLKDLIDSLAVKAAYDASKLMFATGNRKFSKNMRFYGLVQCTRDLSQSDCRSCLSSALEDLLSDFREGGTVFSGSCNVRFQLYKFYHDSTATGDGWKMWVLVVVAVACVSTFVLLIVCYASHRRQRKTTQTDEEQGQNALLENSVALTNIMITEEPNLVTSQELPFTELAIIKAATDNFSDSNKLGQGGFGIVYKGVLPNGKEIAVKRLSRKSWQGLEEFKNEIILIARLQHRNLVRLLGCAIEGDEKLLIYEYMSNKSLDFFIFDPERRSLLDWNKRVNIINGIARGLLYLHEDSRLKIIHRDLKPSNVLLDQEMVAKISDFGMARIFGEDQNTANTRRVVGTYGYMAPEYAMDGIFSVKSDVFSFGVILLEIIGGKRNSGFYLTEYAQTLLAYAWRLWNDGHELEFVDPLLTESCPTAEVLRYIHIGLLCVQEDPAERPTMSAVVVLLESKLIALPEPSQPAFSVGRVVQNVDQSSTTNPSVNKLTISSILPR